MNSIRDKIAKFMYGRYGAVDQFSRAISIICLILLVITLFVHNNVIYFVAAAGIVYVYYRAFSRNISRRNTENQAFLRLYYRIFGRFNKTKAQLKDSKTHKIFKCPGCSQKIRVPRGKGNICIKCPKCRIEFIRKT